MSLHTIKQITSSTLSKDLNWDWSNQTDLASLKPPETLMGVRKDVMQGDITREWCKLIVEQFIDESFLSETCSFAKVYKEVSICVHNLTGMQYTDSDKKNISIHISQLVLERVKVIVEGKRKRSRISALDKTNLLDIYGKEPRCWLTGYKFSKEAIYNFTADKGEQIDLKLPLFVDKYKPIGVIERDIRIEIDHLYPFSLGGDDSLDNFRLICGWANKVKSNHVTGYSLGSKLAHGVNLNPKSNYYWALRLIGLKRKCEVDGCNKTLENSELTVCSIFGRTKNINPLSMKVVCEEHDNLPSRFVKRDLFVKL